MTISLAFQSCQSSRGRPPAPRLDWAWLTDTDNMGAAPTPAALIACPNNLEPNNFISNFPIQMTFLCKPGFPRQLANWLGYGGFPGSLQGRRAIRPVTAASPSGISSSHR